MPKDLHQLPKVKESISFIYVEHCRIEQDAMAIAKYDKEGGKTPIPIANTVCLLVGPGTNITHAAIKAIADCGCSVVWCGENDTRFYAYGRGETENAKNLLIQAALCMNEDLHMQVVRKMYEMRFSGIDTKGKSLNQLRGIEGVRMKSAYSLAEKVTGVKLEHKDLKSTSYEDLPDINKALVYANQILYAICSSAIVSMGLSTGLGFIHTGRMESFTYDLADLYKAQTTIPAAFEATKNFRKTGVDLKGEVRRLCRQKFTAIKLMKQIPKDIAAILNSSEDNMILPDSHLWSASDASQYFKGHNLSYLLEEH